MKKIFRAAILSMAVATSIVAVPAATQKPFTPPVPAQVLSAKKVFISNGGSSVGSADTISPDLPYDEFYAAMQSWGRFELLSAPAEADLVFEIRFVTVTANSNNRSVYVRRQLELRVIDPKTGIRLWTIDEQFDEALMDSNKRKDLDTGIAALTSDLKRLAVPLEPVSQANPAAPDKQGKTTKHIW
jgi:hypothetical protein